MLRPASFGMVSMLGEEDKLTRITIEFERRLEELREHVNKEISKINERIGKLEKQITALNAFVFSFSHIESLLTLLLLTTERLSEDAVRSAVEAHFNNLKEFCKKFSRYFDKRDVQEVCSILSDTLIFAARIHIKFDELAAIILRALGKKLASKIIDENTILQVYGSDATIKWRKLLS